MSSAKWRPFLSASMRYTKPYETQPRAKYVYTYEMYIASLNPINYSEIFTLTS